MMRKVLDVFVPGHPKTKGSMDSKGDGYMVENVAGSTTWRKLMAKAFAQAWNADGVHGPLTGGVRVMATFYLPCARGDRSLIAARSGDVDKLTRNLLDALAIDSTGKGLGAGVFANDSQVVGIVVEKTMAADASGPHAREAQRVSLDAGIGAIVRPQGVHVQVFEIWSF